MPKADGEGKKIVANNRKALFHYEIIEEYEAGLSLLGPEVKSVRAGQVSLEGAYARVENQEAYVHNLHIAPYTLNTIDEISPTRARKLLMKRQELHRLLGRQQDNGLSLIPLEIYIK